MLKAKFCFLFTIFILFSVCIFADDLDANLRFSHKTHNQNSITCSRCHIDNELTLPKEAKSLPPGWQPLKKSRILASSVPAIASLAARESGTFARPGEKRCLECHFKKRQGTDCALCHLDKPGKTKRKRRRLVGYVKFSHAKHIGVACNTCHSYITNWETLNGNHVKTRMEFCLECHNGRKISNNCKMCHDPIPHPKDHVKNYTKKHGIAYRANPSKCKMCHQESSCVQCHARKPKDHTLAWVSRRHGFEATTNPRKCNACHSDKWVCKRCHANSK